MIVLLKKYANHFTEDEQTLLLKLWKHHDFKTVKQLVQKAFWSEFQTELNFTLTGSSFTAPGILPGDPVRTVHPTQVILAVKNHLIPSLENE